MNLGNLLPMIGNWMQTNFINAQSNFTLTDFGSLLLFAAFPSLVVSHMCSLGS